MVFFFRCFSVSLIHLNVLVFVEYFNSSFWESKRTSFVYFLVITRLSRKRQVIFPIIFRIEAWAWTVSCHRLHGMTAFEAFVVRRQLSRTRWCTHLRWVKCRNLFSSVRAVKHPTVEWVFAHKHLNIRLSSKVHQVAKLLSGQPTNRSPGKCLTLSHQTLVRLIACQLPLSSRVIVFEAQEKLWPDALPVVTNDFYGIRTRDLWVTSPVF